MPLSLDDLLQQPTEDQVFDEETKIAADLEFPVTDWEKGSVFLAAFRLFARVLIAWFAYVSQAIRGGLLDYAADAWLTLLARNVYNVERIPATYAAAANALTLTNTGGGLYTIAANDLIIQKTGTGQTYRNTSGGTLNPSGTLTLDLRAEEVGTVSNAAPGTLTTLVTTLLGVTCTNPISLLGTDDEADDALRIRCRDSMGALSPNGPAAAYDYVAKSTKRTDGSTVDINRVRVIASTTTGHVTVILASSSGAPASGDVTLVDAALAASAVPLTATLVTQAATVLVVDVSYEIWADADAGYTEAELETAILAALQAYFPRVPIGGYTKTSGGAGFLWHTALEGVIKSSVAPAGTIFAADLSLPAGDVSLGAAVVPALGAVTPTVHLVAQG